MNDSGKCIEVSPGKLHSQLQGFLDKPGVNRVLDPLAQIA